MFIVKSFQFRVSSPYDAVLMIMELKSLKKKYKSKGFAAGCSREVIERGAEQLGWELQKLLTMTLQAMADCEDEIKSEMDAEE